MIVYSLECEGYIYEKSGAELKFNYFCHAARISNKTDPLIKY